MSDAIGLIYIGKGSFIDSVPARDLTVEEVERCGGAETLIASGLYALPSAIAQSSDAEAQRNTQEAIATRSRIDYKVADHSKRSASSERPTKENEQ